MHVQLHCKANSSMVKPVTSSTNYIHSSNYTAYTLPPPTQRFKLHSTDTSPTNPTVRWQLHQQSIPVNCAVRDKGDVPTLAKARGSAFAGTAAQAEEKKPDLPGDWDRKNGSLYQLATLSTTLSSSQVHVSSKENESKSIRTITHIPAGTTG